MGPPPVAARPGFTAQQQFREHLAEGLRYYYGQGVGIDYPRAAQAFADAAQGEGRAAYYLAIMHGRGQGVGLNRHVAFEWLKYGVALGDVECDYMLGMVFLRGDPGVVAPDVEQAVRWLRAAADKGHAEAAQRLREIGRLIP